MQTIDAPAPVCLSDKIEPLPSLLIKERARSHGTGKLVNGLQVGQIGPVDSCGQVEDLDPSLENSHKLSRVGQVRTVDLCGQVRNIDPSG